MIAGRDCSVDLSVRRPEATVPDAQNVAVSAVSQLGPKHAFRLVPGVVRRSCRTCRWGNDSE